MQDVDATDIVLIMLMNADDPLSGFSALTLLVG